MKDSRFFDALAWRVVTNRDGADNLSAPLSYVAEADGIPLDGGRRKGRQGNACGTYQLNARAPL